MKKMNLSNFDSERRVNVYRDKGKLSGRKGSIVYSSMSDMFAMKESVKTSQKGVYMHKMEMNLPGKPRMTV
jgi:hypothetical protein